jgi:hypothetical protein
MIFASIASYDDFLELFKIKSRKRFAIFKFLDTFYASVVFPFNFFMMTIFWSFCAIDEDLVIPAAIKPYLTPIYNHLVHTVVAIPVIFEMLLAKRNYPSRISGLKITVTLLMIMFILIYVQRFLDGFFQYQFLEYFSILEHVLLIAFVLILGIVLYMLGEMLNKAIWSGKNEKRE